KAGQFLLVGEDDVDGALTNEIKELGAVAIDAEGVRQRQRHLARSLVRDRRRLDEGLLRLRRVPKIAFEVGDGGRGDRRFVDVGRLEVLRRAEKGVHGALAVRRHHDVAARGRRTAATGGSIEGDAGGPNIVDENAAKLVVADFADEGRAGAETGDADDGVGGRAAGG